MKGKLGCSWRHRAYRTVPNKLAMIDCKDHGRQRHGLPAGWTGSGGRPANGDARRTALLSGLALERDPKAAISMTFSMIIATAPLPIKGEAPRRRGTPGRRNALTDTGSSAGDVERRPTKSLRRRSALMTEYEPSAGWHRVMSKAIMTGYFEALYLINNGVCV